MDLGKCGRGHNRVLWECDPPKFATDFRHPGVRAAGRSKADGNGIALAGDGQSQGTRNLGVRMVLPQDDNAFGLKSCPRAAVRPHSLHIIVLLGNGRDGCPPNDLAQRGAEELIDALLARVQGHNSVNCLAFELQEHIRGHGRVSGESQVMACWPRSFKVAFASRLVPVLRRSMVMRRRPKLQAGVAESSAQPSKQRWPWASGGIIQPPIRCEVLAVDVGPSDAVVEFCAVLKFELSMQVDFDQRPEVSLLGLEELIPAIAAGPLSIVELIERFAKDPGDPEALGVQLLKRSSHSVQLAVARRFQVHEGRLGGSALVRDAVAGRRQWERFGVLFRRASCASSSSLISARLPLLPLAMARR